MVNYSSISIRVNANFLRSKYMSLTIAKIPRPDILTGLVVIALIRFHVLKGEADQFEIVVGRASLLIPTSTMSWSLYSEALTDIAPTQ